MVRIIGDKTYAKQCQPPTHYVVPLFRDTNFSLFNYLLFLYLHLIVDIFLSGLQKIFVFGKLGASQAWCGPGVVSGPLFFICYNHDPSQP